jgi:hypothetical protein
MTSRHRPTPETQDGGRQTGSTCISRSVVDRNKIRNVISMLSMSARPINSSPTPADIDRHRKRKDGGRQTGSTRISRTVSISRN